MPTPITHLCFALLCFKVIGTDTDRFTTYDFLLTFHSNHGPMSYRFRDKRRFQSKIAKFSHSPCILRPCWCDSPWNWVPALVVKKTRMAGVLDVSPIQIRCRLIGHKRECGCIKRLITTGTRRAIRTPRDCVRRVCESHGSRAEITRRSHGAVASQL